VSDEDVSTFIPIIDAILFESDLTTVSVKKVRNGLQTKIGYDKQIDLLIADRFENVLAQREYDNGVKQEEDAEGEDEDEYEQEVKEEVSEYSFSATVEVVKAVKHELAAELHAQWNSGRPSRSAKKKPVKPAPKVRKSKKSDVKVNSDGSDGEKPTKKKRKANPNSPFMAPLILSEPLSSLLGETMLSRPETVKRIWAYVKERNLQDPEDKRYIICDDSMKPIFGNKIHML
ncbi:SWIB-domain-containing protein, partial [Choiromyces venosus 120613-1]